MYFSYFDFCERLCPSIKVGQKMNSIVRNIYMTDKSNQGSPVAAEHFTAAMAQAATGVSIVTTDGVSGRFGMTVSAIASVSAEPPLVLACINRRSPMIEAIGENRVFCVNLLNTKQRAFADKFAGRPHAGDPYTFEDAHWGREITGAPVLIGALAQFDCTLESSHDAGSHRVFIGRVHHAGSTQNAPLVYNAREYQQLTQLQEY